MNETIQYFCQKELTRKLDHIDSANFSSQQEFQSACLKLADEADQIYRHFTNFDEANIIACSYKNVNTHKEIARYIWDRSCMNFN